MEENQLSATQTPKSILLYALPTVFTMLFMSVYMIVDGIFVATYINELAFSALNIVYPVISSVLALGLMLAIGSSAIIGKLLGEGEEEKAQSFLSQIYAVGILLGGSLTLITLTFPHQILKALQTTDAIYPYAEEYLIYTGLFFIPSILQVFAQTFLVANGTPLLGAFACFLGGCTNMLLDYIFIGKLQWGIKGAAIGTGLGFAVPGFFALLYFLCQKKSLLRLRKFQWDFPLLLHCCINGSSEFVTNLAVAITTFLFNVILLRIAGDSGVASITAILYIQMIQMGLYMGFSLGVSPLISFKLGEKSYQQLSLIIKTSFQAILLSSLLSIILLHLYKDPLIALFIPNTSETFAMAKDGFTIYASAYLFMGFNVFLSSMFTALSNGKISALLSCTRSLVFIVFFLLTLPAILDIQGVWIAVPIAELLSLFLSLYFYKKYQPIYHYGQKKNKKQSTESESQKGQNP